MSMILLGLAVAVTAIMIIFNRHITIPFGTLIICAVSGISILVELNHNIFLIAIPLLCIVGWGAFCYRFKDLDFNKRILSLAPDLNRNSKTNGRIIGRCLPYYRGQLKYNNSTIVQNDLSLKGGTIITGSSGSGKTYSIIQMIKQDVNNGKSVAFFNFKGDKETMDDIEDAVSSRAVVYKLSWDECNFTYDPLINLDDAGRVEAILNMRKWSIDGGDDHYKTGTQLFLQKTIKDFNYNGGNYLRGYYNFLRKYNVPRELYDSYNTVMKLLELTITSNVGGIFSESDNEFRFDNEQQYVLLVSFTSSTKTLGTSITSLMLRDLMEVGTRKPYDPDLCLYVDEFGSCESPLVVKDILEKGRSCKISTVISMQDLNQLIINTNAPFLDSVLGTVNSYIVFAGSTRQTAEKLSGTQIYEIDNLLMSLRKPVNGRPPTAIFISKYPVFLKNGGTEVYRFIPYSPKKSLKVDTNKIPIHDKIEKPEDNLDKDFIVSSDSYFDLDDYQNDIEERVRDLDNGKGSVVRLDLRDVNRFL